MTTAASQSDFENAYDAFTRIMSQVANWKSHYYGATYATRLSHAIDDARAACDSMEAAIRADRKR